MILVGDLPRARALVLPHHPRRTRRMNEHDTLQAFRRQTGLGGYQFRRRRGDV